MARNLVGQQLEQLAAKTVAGQLGGRTVQRDVRGAPDGTHDFDIHCKDNLIIALEVTRAAHPPFIVMLERLRRKTGRPAPGLRQSWLLSGHYGYLPVRRHNLPDIDKLRQQAIAYLHEMETAGIRELSDTVDPHAAEQSIAAVEGLRQLGIVNARPMADHPPPARLFFGGFRGYSGPVSLEGINRVAEVETGNNLAKLNRAKADERHIFIWVDTSVGAAGVSLAADRLPTRSPSVPPEVDQIWIGFAGPTESGQPTVEGLWSWRHGAGWASVNDDPRNA